LKYLYVCRFVRMNFFFFFTDFESEIFIGIRISFSNIKFYSTWDFARIYYFEFFTNSIRMLRRNQCTKEEGFFFIEKYSGIHFILNILRSSLTRNNYLFFEDGFKIITINSWNARFSYYIIFDSSGLIFGVSSCNINS
jgi:hypothetical protein